MDGKTLEELADELGFKDDVDKIRKIQISAMSKLKKAIKYLMDNSTAMQA